jgi:hypothetical protein
VSTLIEQRPPRYRDAEVVVRAPAAGVGNWAGAPSCVLADGVFYLAYRIRRPIVAGRGVSVVVARSVDGVRFESVCEIGRDAVGAASLERPAIIPTDDGWRLYLSCATANSRHWWIEALDAPTAAQLPHGRRRIALPGDAGWGVKDPVVVRTVDGWRMWVCCHPLGELGQEDRMVTRHATSDDGLVWQDQGVALVGRPSSWDARGARVTAILDDNPLTVLYDGRATAADNWHETTGLARDEGDGVLQRIGTRALATSPEGDGAFRYVSAVPLPDGRTRYYFEASRSDGSHDLMTCL